MHWYRIRVTDGSSARNFDGSSEDSFETMAEKAARGEYLRLDNLRYWDQKSVIRDWVDWDSNDVPSVYINPQKILIIQPYKSDPLTAGKSSSE